MTTFSAPFYVASATTFADKVPVARFYERTIDFSVQNMTSGDVVNMFSLPAGALVLYAGMEVLTACTTSTTAAIGDGGSSTRFIGQTAVATTGHKVVTDSIAHYQYPTADILLLTLAGANPIVGKIRVYMVMVEAVSHPAATTAVL